MVHCFEILFESEGSPDLIQSDNGKEFKNSLMRYLLQKWGVTHLFGRPRHPQSQGQIERANQTL